MILRAKPSDANARAIAPPASGGAGAITGHASQDRPLTYRAELDGLRGIAVLAVMAYHYQLPPLTPQGFLGVDIFFVLSGFLITSILTSEWQRSGSVDWRRFYLRRAFRLLPAFWLMVLLLSPTVPTSAGLLSLGYAINWTTALGLVPVNQALGHTWSLALEWQYYLIWPVVLVLALRRWSPRTVALVALSFGLALAGWRGIVWTSGQDWMRVWHATDTHADGLLIGSALGVVATFSLVPITARLDRALTATTGVALVLVVAMLAVPGLPLGFLATIGISLFGLAVAVIVARVAVYPSGPLGQLLSFGPLVRVGAISYGLYLWHVPIRVLFGQHGPVMAGLCAVLTFLAAGISYRYVERPFLRAKVSLRRKDPILADSPGPLSVPIQS